MGSGGAWGISVLGPKVANRFGEGHDFSRASSR
jgi:hypothetical protein